MQKIFFILFLWSGIAQATTVNHVWLTAGGGNLEVLCRHVWNEYDTKHATKTVFFIKPGADGLLATQDMLNFSSPRKFLCAGSTVITNRLVYPENYSDKVEILLQSVVTPLVWYSPNTNQSKDFPELVAYWKSLNRPVNVGIFFSTSRGLVNQLEKVHGLNINLINYRSAPQMYPDLAQGSLDLALDAGGSVDVAQGTGKFRVLGYVHNNNIKSLKDYPNFITNQLEHYIWQGIFIPNTMPKETKLQVSKELKAIMMQQPFKELAAQYHSTATAIEQPEVLGLVHRQWKIMEKYWK
jgi:tripartite-type tricarboxylate transporter receptor subunit TctC